MRAHLQLDAIRNLTFSLLVVLCLASTGQKALAASTPATATAAPADTLILHLSEDAYQGDAQFIASIDGVALTSAPQTIVVHQPTGLSQDFVYTGNWGKGPHTITVNFVNDACNWSSCSGDGNDRNIFVNAIDFDTAHIAPADELYGNGAVNFTVNATPPAGADSLTLYLAEDAYQGDAQFTATIDGVALSATPQAVTAHQSKGQTQAFTYSGNWGQGPHKVAISFVNDACGGSCSGDGNDRNLYVNAIDYDATHLPVANVLYGNSTVTYSTVASTLVLQLSEDAYQGDAEFTVAIDGVPLTTTPQTVLVHQPSGQVQDFAYIGDWGSGPHTVTVSFINDNWDGTSSADGHDRNLYIASVSYNNVPVSAAEWLYSNGADSFAIPDTTPAAAAPPAAMCGTYASGSNYSISTASNGTAAASASQCPYGGTQPITTTVTQNYSCNNGTQVAVGSSVSSVANNGNPTCKAAASCNGYASGSSYTLMLSSTSSSTAAAASACPYGGTQPVTTTVTQTYSCTNGTQTAVGAQQTSTVAAGSAVCVPPVNGACGAAINDKSAATIPFPLGVYEGNPDNTSAANQAAFLAGWNDFSQLMKTTPQYMDAYINGPDPISHWASQQGWNAASWAATPQLKNTIPVIGLPLNSTQDNFDTDFQAFAAGQYDSMLDTLVSTWAQNGYKTQYWRVSWEMNLNSNPNYGGDLGSPQQLDWIAAFKHVYTVMHSSAAKYGVTLQIIWNPGTTSYSNAGNAMSYFWPGAQYVDIIGVDDYADIYNFGLYDFTTGQYDATMADWEANPANLIHYYDYPAATQWSNDGSTGHSTTLLDLISFAQANNKPMAIVETGAGNSGDDIFDNGVFPPWLMQTLQQAKQNGVKILFVNIWDSNGGGTYEFSHPGDNKPQEAAAWAQSFGRNVPAPTANLCAVGTASDVSGADPFNWTCSGSYGGATASCSVSE